jgi:hypothetical protein
VPKATIAGVLAAEGRLTPRERKLNLLVTVLLVIMINIHTSDSIADVLEKMAQGLRYIWPDPDYLVPNASAITYRRYQVGARPLVALFHQVCQPLATPDTPGAFLFGLRLMAAETHRLVTTLLDPEAYPILDLICAYHERWEVEITIDEIDTHQRLLPGPLRSLKPVGIIQEPYGLLIAHYLIRALMHAVAQRAGLDPDRLSFVGAIKVLQKAVPEFQMTAPEQLPALYQRLLRDMARKRLPQRRLRSNPRVVKRKMSNFKLKRAEHLAWPQPTTRSFRESIEVKMCQELTSPIIMCLPSQPGVIPEPVLI